MNNNRRKRLQAIARDLQTWRDILQDITDEETESRDNIPENLQGSERYELAEQNCDNLESALSSLDEALAYLEQIE